MNFASKKNQYSIQSMINEIKDQKLKTIYDQFNFSFLTDFTKIKEILPNFLKNSKLILYNLSSQNLKKPVFSINEKYCLSSQTIICVEKKCLIIDDFDNDTILEILNKTHSHTIIDVKKSNIEETQIFCSHFYKYNDFSNNVFVKNTIFTILSFIIQRFFYPTFYFDDPNFFLYKNDKNLEQEFHKKLNIIFESKRPEEMHIYDIIEIFLKSDDNTNNISHFEHFSEDDFIKLKKIYEKQSDGLITTFYLVIHLNSLHIFLMKKFSCAILNKYQKREVDFCSKYSHKCFVKCYGFLNNNNSETIGIIYEYLCNNSLKYFNQMNKISPIYSFITMIRIYDAIKYLYNNELIHRDLKPSNILLNNDFIPYISDNETIRNIDEIKDDGTADIGSNYYISPEQFCGKISNYQSDVFSFGLIIYYLFEHNDLIKNVGEREKYIKNIEFKNCTKSIQNIINSCIEIDKNKRIKFNELEEMIINEIISSVYFQKYFTNIKFHDRFELEIEKYLYQSFLILHQLFSFDKVIKLFYCDYFSICLKLTEIDEYKSVAFNNLGNLFYCCIIVTKNYSKAKKYYEDAIKLNNSVSLNNLGNMYKTGTGVKQDYKHAIYYYEKAAKLNNSNSFYNLGYFYYNGYGVEESITKAIEYFEKSANLNNTHGLNALGYIYVVGKKIDRDFLKAKTYYKKALELNNTNSNLNLAYLYIEGYGVEKDYLRAAQYYNDAVKKNNDKAMIHLGKMYKKGQGVTIDLQKAKELFEKAANLGNVDAFHLLGNLYLHGKGVKIDYEKARKYYKMASMNSDRSSLYKLGIIYEKGLGIEKNILKAKEYYEMAAKKGYFSAYINLANFYINDEFFDVDEEKAKNYYLNNISTKSEKIIFENNGFYRVRKNLGYYPSHNDIGLIYLFQNEGENALKYLKVAAFNEYQFALNNYALLCDPSIKKDKNFLKYNYFDQYSEDDNFHNAYEKYEKAAKAKFSLAEFNFAHMLEDRGFNEDAIKYYEKASKHEHYPFIFHNKERHDERLIASLSFIIFFTDCKLFLEFSKSNKYKSKEYFIKIISRLQNEKEINSFEYIKETFLDLLFLTNQNDSHDSHDKSIDLSKINKNKYEIKDNIKNSINRKYKKFIKKKPNQLYNYIIESDTNWSLFIQKIKDVISLMESILYTAPYYILFGRIKISNPCLKKMTTQLVQNINDAFYEGFGFPNK